MRNFVAAWRSRLSPITGRSRGGAADPDTDLAAIAADLGYTDHAHLTRDFRQVLGFTPSEYRRESLVAPPAAAPAPPPADTMTA